MNLKKVRNIFLHLFVIGFFLYPIFQTILIGVAFLLTLFTGELKKIKGTFFTNKPALILVALFLSYLLSMLYTSNVLEGWKGIELKFTMLAIPLFLPVILKENKKLIDKLLKTFVSGAFLYVLFSLILACINYSQTGEARFFFYTDLGFSFPENSPNIHPTYASIFYNVAIFFTLDLLRKNIKNRNKSIVYIVYVVFFLLFVFLLASKFGILLLGINLFLIFMYYIIRTKKIILFSLLFTLLIGFFAVLIYTTPTLNSRFTGFVDELFHKQNTQEYQSTGIRIKVWETTVNLIKENPVLGVGVGDLRDELTAKYREENIVKFEEQRYDSHQQFLQTFATLGMFGGVLLILVFVSLFHRSYIQKDSLLFAFSLFFLFFGIIESMLERQAGLVFFCFFGMLLYYNKPSKIKPNLD